MKVTKRILFLSFFTGALLIAGLFLYLRNLSPVQDEVAVKPSQLNFTERNQLPTGPSNGAIAAGPQAEKVNASEATSSSPLTKAQQLTGEDKRKWDVFESILNSKNDSDPRLDRELRILAPAVHQALYEKYDSLPAEDRAGRGLAVFLLTRNLSSVEDFQFLKKVYQESPCLSLQDCKSAAPDDPHHSAVNQTTLVYPQLAPLHLIEQQLTENPRRLDNVVYRSGVIQVVATAENFPVPAVQEKARALRTQFNF